jgi:hypothetical protein
MSRSICLIATPEVRNVCPPEYIEGLWKEIPDKVTSIEIKTPPEARELEVVFTGRFTKTGPVAEICEVRYSRYEVY